MSDIGHCKHGEFKLSEGCPQCIAERRAQLNQNQPAPETNMGFPSLILPDEQKVDFGKPLQLIKVQYLSTTTGQLSDREYTYYSEDELEVGDIIEVPVRDTTGKARVSAIGVVEAEIASFKDKVKTIPAGSKIVEEYQPGKYELGSPAEPDPESHKVKITPISFGDKTESISGADMRLQLLPGEDSEIRNYHQESQKLLEYAENRVIASTDDYKIASDDLAIISRIKKAMSEKRKEYLDPILGQAEAIRNSYNHLMKPILSAEKTTKDKMLTYTAEQERIRKEQEAINQKRLEAAEAEMKLTGELSESVNLTEVAPEAPKRISTELGTSGQRDNWKFEVIDIDALPREYMIPDMVMLGAIAKRYHDTKKINGVRFYNEPIIQTRTR